MSRRVGKDVILVPVPNVFTNYQKNMNRVDRRDQKLGKLKVYFCTVV